MNLILIQPAPDRPGEFVAHHLGRDLVVRGSAPREALANCLGAVERDLDGEESPAPEEFYEAAKKVVERGSSASLDEPHDVFVVEIGEDSTTTWGLNLADQPGLVVPVRVPELP